MEPILREIERLANERPDTARPLVVGIDGKGGAGKSTLARSIAEVLPDSATIQMDDFYLPSAERPNDSTTIGGKFDLTRLIHQVLEPACAGQAPKYQRYDWDNDRLGENWVEVGDVPVVLVEGVYSTCSRLRPFMSLCIWVETPRGARLSRGIDRDGEDMRSMWTEVWMPAEDSYVSIERPDASAHIVVSGDSGEYRSSTLRQR
jgi:uridine kinase